MEVESLAKQFNINEDEVKTMAARINFMLTIQQEQPFKMKNEEKIVTEWMSIAHRLRKGKELIEEYEATLSHENLEQSVRYNKLVNLYSFLLSVLGFYDGFLKSMMSESHHKNTQSTILEIILD